MKTDGFVAKTNEISDKEHLEKVAEKVYNVKEITDILLEILSDYVEQVIFMKDESGMFLASTTIFIFLVFIARKSVFSPIINLPVLEIIFKPDSKCFI